MSTALKRPWPWLTQSALLILAALVLLPPLAVMLYGLSTRWDRSLFPEQATLRWVQELLDLPRVHSAITQTLWLSGLSASLTLLLGGSASLAAYLYAPRLRQLLDAMSLLPYAIPPIVVAIGALELFVGRWGAYLDLRLVYVGVIVPLLFPLLHKTLGAALAQLDALTLLEAGRTLGASDAHLLRRVLLPLLAPALAACLLLCWVTAAMEFAIANLLLGGTVELLQPLMNGLRGVNGHQSAALVLLSFMVVTGMGTLVEGMTAWRQRTRSK
jgi:ABC-type spermidine/putrescine transport system permease subunit II